MTTAVRIRKRNGGSPLGRPSSETDDTPSAPAEPARRDEDLQQIVTTINQQMPCWRDSLAVSIGRASTLSGLKEAQIRYFENLKALQPSKMTEQAGASRLFTLTDIRRLAALALLLKRGYRSAEAAQLIIERADQIDSGVQRDLVNILEQESKAVADGFLLTRLVSQLIDAAQAALNDLPQADPAPSGARPDDADTLRVIGLLLPMRAITEAAQLPTVEDVQQLGRRLAQASGDILIAYDRAYILPPDETQILHTLKDSGRNDSTVLFYSHEAWALPSADQCRYCLYLPEQRPDLPMLLMVDAPAGVPVPHVLRRCGDTRMVVFDRILALCASIFPAFRESTLAKNYRYRSDGFPIEQSQRSYSQLLERIRAQVFPGDPDSMAAILIPDNLDAPSTLAILAHDGSSSALGAHIRLDLAGEGQGLCGRAYNTLEPFFSLDASVDPRGASALEEGYQVALAVPFVASWGLASFGVLYLASRREHALDSHVAFLALVLGNSLGESLGRWWLTRLRRRRDLQLHQQMGQMVSWLESLDQHGPSFQRALGHLEQLWGRIAQHEGEQDTCLALVVLDIDRYGRSVQDRSDAPILLAGQAHVNTAVHKIVPGAASFWFKNDHLCLFLDGYDANQVVATVRRIAGQVRAVPLDIMGGDAKKLTISVSAAITVLTYQELHDLDPAGGTGLRQQAATILDQLREQTAQVPNNTIQLLTAEGWRVVEPGLRHTRADLTSNSRSS